MRGPGNSLFALRPRPVGGSNRRCAATPPDGLSMAGQRTVRGANSELWLKLSAYEAMVNVVEHAYPAGIDDATTFTLTARLHHTELTVSVTDHGRRSQNSSTREGGRGLPLIRALAPGLTIDSSAVGTTSAMTWPSTVGNAPLRVAGPVPARYAE